MRAVAFASLLVAVAAFGVAWWQQDRIAHLEARLEQVPAARPAARRVATPVELRGILSALQDRAGAAEVATLRLGLADAGERLAHIERQVSLVLDFVQGPGRSRGSERMADEVAALRADVDALLGSPWWEEGVEVEAEPVEVAASAEQAAPEAEEEEELAGADEEEPPALLEREELLAALRAEAETAWVSEIGRVAGLDQEDEAALGGLVTDLRAAHEAAQAELLAGDASVSELRSRLRVVHRDLNERLQRIITPQHQRLLREELQKRVGLWWGL